MKYIVHRDVLYEEDLLDSVRPTKSTTMNKFNFAVIPFYFNSFIYYSGFKRFKYDSRHKKSILFVKTACDWQ